MNRLHPCSSTRRAACVAAFAGVLALTLTLGGCGGAGQDTAAGDNQPAANATPGPGGTLTIAVQDGAKHLDPHAANDAASMHLIENFYSTLLRYGDSYGELEPDLATRVDISEDQLTYTIHLRENATFHSGRPVTAADVIYSIERIRDKEIRAPHFAAVTAIEAPDAKTVVLRLERKAAPLRTYLAHPMNAIVDRTAVEENGGSLDTIECGSGPFKLEHWRKDQELRMVRFEDYPVAERPYLDAVAYRPMPDETARTTALRTGEIDLVLDLPIKDLTLLEADGGLAVESVPGTFWEYVGMNTRRDALADARVRQAIAHAIDRNMLNSLVKFGKATVLPGAHIPPNHWAHADLNLYPKQDLPRARALLAEAGYADGLSLVMKVGSAFPYQVQAAQVVKQHLADAGIDVTLQSLESAVFFDALGRGDFDLTLVGWVGFVDPDEWTWNLFHSQGKWNQQGYANPEVDRLLDEGRATLDRAARKGIYAQALEIIAREAPMAFLYVTPQISAWQPHVRGFVVHPTATTLSLRDTWIAR